MVAWRQLKAFSLILLAVGSFTFFCESAGGQESMRFDSEARKLDFIRHYVATHRKQIKPFENSPPDCFRVLNDFLADRHFKAIEPVVIADSEDDPRLAKWDQCRGSDYRDLGLAPEELYGSLRLLGGPPYRYYRVELDGNKSNGPEDLIYQETPKDPSKQTNQTFTGYTWVDLKRCKMKGTFHATGYVSRFSSKKDAVYLNVLIDYKGQVWFLDYVEGFSLTIARWLGRGMKTCSWDIP